MILENYYLQFACGNILEVSLLSTVKLVTEVQLKPSYTHAAVGLRSFHSRQQSTHSNSNLSTTSTVLAVSPHMESMSSCHIGQRDTEVSGREKVGLDKQCKRLVSVARAGVSASSKADSC